MIRSPDATVALIMAAAAAEGFINELGERCGDYDHHGLESEAKGRIAAFHGILKEIESSRGRTQQKYLMGSLALSGTMLDRGKNPFQDLDLLFDLRNVHMHLQIIPSEVHVPEDLRRERARSLLPKRFRVLQTRGLAHPEFDGISLPWLRALQTKEMAIWACRTCTGIMQVILDMFPDGAPNPSYSFKRDLQDYRESDALENPF